MMNKPCPFCGGEPFSWIVTGGIGFVVENVGLKHPDQI